MTRLFSPFSSEGVDACSYGSEVTDIIYDNKYIDFTVMGDYIGDTENPISMAFKDWPVSMRSYDPITL